MLQRGDLLLEGGVLLGNAWAMSASSGEAGAARSSSERASIWQARIAALSAPSMATVATGMPEGICTVASNASSPSKVEDFTGMPMTGKVVWAASTPARWAAFPAAAMMTPKPCSRAVRENSAAHRGCGGRT